jgi:hypothetical protein
MDVAVDYRDCDFYRRLDGLYSEINLRRYASRQAAETLDERPVFHLINRLGKGLSLVVGTRRENLDHAYGSAPFLDPRFNAHHRHIGSGRPRESEQNCVRKLIRKQHLMLVD